MTSVLSVAYSFLSTADEVDDLDLVLRSDEGERPLTATDDVAIELDGDAFLGQGEQRDHPRKVGAVGNLARFAIEIELNFGHGAILAIAEARP